MYLNLPLRFHDWEATRLCGNQVLNPASFNTIVIQSRKRTIARLRCTRQKLLFSYLCFRESECDFTLFYDNKKSKLNDEKCSKISKDAKQYALQAVLKLAPPQNTLKPSLYSEDIYTLAKSCSYFCEISYYLWYLILCRELLLSKLCPGSIYS